MYLLTSQNHQLYDGNDNQQHVRDISTETDEQLLANEPQLQSSFVLLSVHTVGLIGAILGAFGFLPCGDAEDSVFPRGSVFRKGGAVLHILPSLVYYRGRSSSDYREEREEFMGLTAVFLCPESHRPQIREMRGRSSWSLIVIRLERGEEGVHGFDSRTSVPRVTSSSD
ncbi:hypothetical protein J6590_079161 [Homalodisca vitripennis]|nr:hypothetical protein J6590_079161 [Homalodisca vitripennis]